jgi:hypothetical protein
MNVMDATFFANDGKLGPCINLNFLACVCVIRPALKRTEGRAPVLSSEFTTKATRLQGTQHYSLLGRT